MPTYTAPDGITPVRGYRTWRLVFDELRSPFAHGRPPWVPGVTVAVCRGVIGNFTGLTTESKMVPLGNGRHKLVHTPPRVGHCGLYAHKDVRELAWCDLDRDVVHGAVDLHGDVEDGPYGYQASHGRIAHLYDTGDAARRAADIYDVPLVEVPEEAPDYREALGDAIHRFPKVFATVAADAADVVSAFQHAFQHVSDTLADFAPLVDHHTSGGTTTSLQRAKPSDRHDYLRIHARKQRKAAR